MSEENKEIITIEHCIPLRESMLWDMQCGFYTNEGISAWNNQVPFYITSNPYIANSYANIILRYAQDSILSDNANVNEPFYILELGAGTGTFSFYLIKQLQALKSALEMSHLRFVYVMTDIVSTNISFWQQHPRFQPWIESGELDFALLDAKKNTDIHLLHSGIKLGATPSLQTKNPLILLANYIFDSLPQDFLLIEKNKIREGLSSLNVPVKFEKEYTLENIKLNLSYRDTQLPYFEDPDLDSILEAYRCEFEKFYLLVPSGAIQCIRHMTAIAGQRLCLLISDKGYMRNLEMNLSQEPFFELHGGCFSLPLNFDIIKRFFHSKDGATYYQHNEQSLITTLHIMGIEPGELPEMQVAASQYLNGTGHLFIFQMYDQLINTKSPVSIGTILTLLPAMQWDPHLFNCCFDQVLQQVRTGEATDSQLRDLSEMMPMIADNYFYTPATMDTLLNISTFFLEMGSYQQAIYWLEKSLAYGTKKEKKHFNLGLCHYQQKSYATALKHFEYVLNEDSDHILSRGYISQIHYEMNKAGVMESLVNTPADTSKWINR